MLPVPRVADPCSRLISVVSLISACACICFHNRYGCLNSVIISVTRRTEERKPSNRVHTLAHIFFLSKRTTFPLTVTEKSGQHGPRGVRVGSAHAHLAGHEDRSTRRRVTGVFRGSSRFLRRHVRAGSPCGADWFPGLLPGCSRLAPWTGSLLRVGLPCCGARFLAQPAPQTVYSYSGQVCGGVRPL